MKKIKIKTPAKINLTLEIVNKRNDGFHNIKSIMQMVSLFDIIEITCDDSDNENNNITISGNSDKIPYNNKNLAYIAAEKFLNFVNIKNKNISIYIEKNIPVEAGLAGGSSNAAGILYGLNKIFDNVLDKSSLLDLASQIGSDVCFCIDGGTQLAEGKGEKLSKIPIPQLNILICKPKNLGVSAKEAYTLYAEQIDKSFDNNTDKMKLEIEKNNTNNISKLLFNALEKSVLPVYEEIKDLKNQILRVSNCKNALMSGSGPSIFAILENDLLEKNMISKENNDVFIVNTINHGVLEV